MSAGFQTLLMYIVLTACFYAWYFKVRVLPKKNLWRFLFFLNMLFGILLVLPVAQYVFQSFGVANNLMNFCLLLMAIAIFLHHSSLLLIFGKKSKSKALEFIHIPLSHVLLGVPYVLTALIGAFLFRNSIGSNIDMTIYLIWVLETAIIGLVVILIGLRLLKLPWT